jgi:hypothetical protein
LERVIFLPHSPCRRRNEGRHHTPHAISKPTVVLVQHGYTLIPKEKTAAPKRFKGATLMRTFLGILRLPGNYPVIQERKRNMTTVIAIIALVSVPYALELYFNPPHVEHEEDEYVPDGR